MYSCSSRSMIIVFSKQWFKKYNKWIVKLAKIPFIGEWVFCFKKYGHYFDIDNLLEVQPNAVVEDMKLMWTKCVKVKGQWVAYDCTNKLHNRLIKKECKEKLLPTRRNHYFVRNEYALRLQKVFYPIWITFHIWDIITRPFPQLNLGFDTLTVYPDEGTGSTTVDGSVRLYGQSSNWATLIATSPGSDGNPSAATGSAIIFSATSTSLVWSRLDRSIYTFDTSSLTSGATISASVLSLYGIFKADDLSCTPNIDIYTATPANDNNLVAGDFSQIGTTSQTGSPITYAGWNASGYNDFTFDSTGRGNVSKTGISKFGCRNANYDVAASTPNWVTSVSSYFNVNWSDNGSNKPKLVVTYTSVVGPANVKTYKGLVSASVKSKKGLAIASIKTAKGLN